MYSLSRIALLSGAKVSGSDRETSDRTHELSLLGARIFIGHNAENVKGATLVVYSHAIGMDNPEIIEANRLNIPTVSRAEYLGAIMLGYNSRIGISGSHGKSTTVAMIDAIFTHAGINPTTLSGADLPIGSPIRIGSKGVMIYEACEYKDSFLRFTPTISVGLNLELDHTDYFFDIDAIKESFTKALGRAESFSLVNGDDENMSAIIKDIKAKVISFGGGEANDYRYSITAFRDDGFDFTVSRFGSVIGHFELNIPGAFNVSNATAAIALSLEYGIDVDLIREAISAYSGITGRLEYIGSRFGRPVYYDYAHHPTEISASINALKAVTRQPLTVVFKPHTFSRTQSLWREFCASLSLADYLIITDIFPARESPIDGITSERLALEIKNAIYSPDNSVALATDLYTHGAIVLMGAGNFDIIKKEIIKI
jgi:UDP-N-acetylmuramate--alanine ligase